MTTRARAVITDETAITWDAEAQAYVRLATTDKRMLVEGGREYKHLGIRDGETVFDLGAHIGGFTRWALRHDPGLVVAVEPDPANYNLLLRNIIAWRVPTAKIVTMQAAISAYEAALLYRNPGRCKGSHSTVAIPGREVIKAQGVRLDWLLECYHPARVKMDIEGEEHAWIPGFQWPSYVLALGIEVHYKNEAMRQNARALPAAMRAQGFTQYKSMNFKGWPEIPCFRRD